MAKKNEWMQGAKHVGWEQARMPGGIHGGQEVQAARKQAQAGRQKKQSGCQNVGQQYRIHARKQEWKLAGQNVGQEAKLDARTTE